jgi:hypothetical protein
LPARAKFLLARETWSCAKFWRNVGMGLAVMEKGGQQQRGTFMTNQNDQSRQQNPSGRQDQQKSGQQTGQQQGQRGQQGQGSQHSQGQPSQGQGSQGSQKSPGSMGSQDQNKTR